MTKTTENKSLTLTTNSIPSDHEMMVFHTMAEQAVSSKMYRGIGDKSGVMMIMLAARELGIPPMQAMNGGLNIIQGKVEISARMMNALIRKQGHKIEVKSSTNEECILVGVRSDTEETQESSFSVEDAKIAGLVKPGGGWVKFPKDMCYARALSRLARQLFPDVIGIGYVEGEIKPTEIKDLSTAEVVSVEPEHKIEDLDNDLQKLLDRFDKEDKFMMLEYISVVKDHFGWSQHECINKFLNEKDLLTKFNNWKNKKKDAQTSQEE